MDAQPAQLRPDRTEDGGRAAARSVRSGRSRWHPSGDTGDSVRTWCASRRHACVRQPAARFPARGSGGHGSVSRGFAARGEQRRLAIRHQRRLSHQWQREQRRRVALCPGSGLRHQPPGAAVALQRQLRVSLRHVRLGCAPVLLHGHRRAKPDYTDVQFNGQFGGPIKIPGLRNRPNIYVAGQRSRTNGTTAESTLVPTSLERAGDFSRVAGSTRQPGAARRSADRATLCGQRDPGGPHQSTGGGTPGLLPETQHRRRRIQLPAAAAHRETARTACSRASRRPSRRGSRRRPR